MYFLIILIFLNITKNLEICAVQIETTDNRMIVIRVYKSRSGDFNHFLKLLDMAVFSLNKPSKEILICGDFNVDYLSRCKPKQKLSLLLFAYNMMHTVDFPTKFQNGHSSAIDNIFVDKSRMQSYVIFPLSNALSDHEAQCEILNNFFPETKVKNGKLKNKCKVILIVSETKLFSGITIARILGKSLFTKDANSSFNNF